MANSTPLILVLDATGKTGSRVANNLTTRGLAVRTAARSGADVRFDWDGPGTYAPALEGVDRVYLLGPVMRTDFAGQVTVFLDQAEAAGVRHITYLSAYGIDAAPPEMAMRSVELDLLGRQGLTHSILRPAWFMQNFSETFLKPVDGAIVVPTGDGAEAFIDAEDIAAAAAATLADSDAHAGAQYALTGPEALTLADAATIISQVTGQTIAHVDLDHDGWVAGAVASGIPAEYGAVLRMLTETIASGRGSRPNSDVEKATGTAPTSFADFARGRILGRGRGPMMAVSNLDDFQALDPFFRIIEEGVAGLVDGEHFFDLLAEDVVFEYIITVPGYPRRVAGRQAVAELYRPYGATIVLDRCYDLAVHNDQVTGVVVLEYASQGRVVPTGAAYSNRYISVLSIVDRKVAHWRDYLDPLAVFDAVGWPAAAADSD